VENAISRFAYLAQEDNEFLNNLAEKLVIIDKNSVKIEFSEQKTLFFRAVILGLKALKIEKDYTLKHIESVYKLQFSISGSGVDLTENARAVKDYNCISIYKKEKIPEFTQIPFCEGEFEFNGLTVKIEKKELSQIKDGLYFDGEKLPENAIIRQRQNGDLFTKFNGGTKKLKDYLIDKKILSRKRDNLPLIAVGNEIYVICPIEISDKIKVDKNTKMIYNISITKGEL
jgi:tRNA(Ile)-lysidine synthase